MSATCQSVIQALEKLAPNRLAEKWDNVGLLVGSPSQMVSGIVVALDIDMQVVNFAVECGANLIVAHHPVIFGGISAIRQDTQQGELLYRLIQQEFAVIVAHTNLDAATGGVNDALATALGLIQTKPLLPAEPEKLYKLAVFVPQQHLAAVRNAITEAGAGHIGLYSHCTFSSPGEGTFLPLENTTPYIGQQGRLEKVAEYKLETIVPEKLCRQVTAAMLAAHPYEEVAYDLYALENSTQTAGMGRLGVLSQPMRLQDFAVMVKQCLSTDVVRVSGDLDSVVATVAVCGGSGADLIGQAKRAGADVFVTGDVKYHQAQQAVGLRLAVIDAGHFATEYPVVKNLVKYLSSCSLEHNWQIAVNSGPGKDIFCSI